MNSDKYDFEDGPVFEDNPGFEDDPVIEDDPAFEDDPVAFELINERHRDGR